MLVLTNLFIIVYIAYAWSWHSPKDSLAKRLVDMASPVILWLGLWHSWKMFAPRPCLVNRRLILELIHANRRKTVVEDVNLEKLSRWSAFLDCRERKYQINLAGTDHKAHWDALCRYAAKHYSDGKSRVVSVNLILARQRIPEPGVFEPNPFSKTVLWKCKVVENQGL
jgi:hypothetical protein